MARHAHLLLMRLLYLTAAFTAASSSAGFHADLNHPSTGSPLSTHEVIRRSARASRAQLGRLEAILVRHRNGISAPLAPLTD
ncbi:unnamed protein product [Urochloa humidicola]